MMYSELLNLTDGKATYEQFLDIEMVYMSKETGGDIMEKALRRKGRKTDSEIS